MNMLKLLLQAHPEPIYAYALLPFFISCFACPFPPPCQCSFRYPNALCVGLNLTSIPEIFPTPYGAWGVNFLDNRLRHIPANAFEGIKLQMLVLSENVIETIDNQAFSGSENSIIDLEIVGNKLTSLPTAFGKLQNLQVLSLSENPLRDFDQEIMKNISKFLTYIDFGSRELREWPTGMKYLTKLSMLVITNASFESLPDDAFSSFKDSLQYLEINNTPLKMLHSSMNKLYHLQELKLNGNTNLTAEAIDESTKPDGLPGLVQVTFHNNGLTTLPDVFQNASQLYSITVLDEPIVSLDDNLFTSNFSSEFQSFTMNNTKLSHVPNCVSKVKSITGLQITNSNISSISKDDFYGMMNLLTLDLSGNPIWNVSDDAFRKNNALKYLHFGNTRLQGIPRSIQNLKSPKYLSLSGCPILCSCDNLGWIKSWKSRPDSFQIDGKCNNIKMDLMDYIKNEIPKCIGQI